MGYKFNVFTGTLDLVNPTGTGDVIGVAPSTPGAIATWVDSAATTIQNTNTNVQQSGAIEAQAFITNRVVSGTVTVNATESCIAPGLQLQPGANLVIEAGGELILI